MPAILFSSPHDNPDDYEALFCHALPDHQWIRNAEAITDPHDIRIALVWAPPPGLLIGLPNLQVVCNLGAGVDGILKDPTYPRHVPLVRVIDPAMTARMTEFIIHRVLTFFRGFHRFDQYQREGLWRWEPTSLAEDCLVGVLGLGVLGTHAAERLAAMDFQVAGWSRSPKDIPGVTCFAGKDQLPTFLNRSHILINLLPLTAQTSGILNKKTFESLPKGAFVINAGRGEHLVEQDLISALNSGHLAGAALDVFITEPLPKDHVFWARDDILVTPHIASETNAKTAAQALVQVIQDIDAGVALGDIPAIVDLDREY